MEKLDKARKVTKYVRNAVCKEFPGGKRETDDADGILEQYLRKNGPIEPSKVARVSPDAVINDSGERERR